MPLVILDVADARAHVLMAAQQRELRALYNDTDERTEPFDPASLEGGVLLGVEEGGELLAIGGLKPLGAVPGEAPSAEIKRMYTRPEARGRQLGRQVLDGLIAWARGHGLTRLVLETGDQQAAAIGLYESAGFERIPNFGYYVGIENSWCYGLDLGAAPRRVPADSLE
ncbi:N-acetyltransferase [Deinococcus irradiatisoli]|uniref:N-acetyltransferase n=1 Tax=Deinococcus irradiatisoli TaxID=2202254 RepID=A0A2Z3JDQ2_9DEIO|nr:GNAT family N-acetyltransferase [Deinococcus irradiatisoli]AWN23313.1 N-acetyltransferase [Deinococcus irradiatisoli]